MLPMQIAVSQTRSAGDSEKLISSFFLTCTDTTRKTKRTPPLAAGGLGLSLFHISSAFQRVCHAVYTCFKRNEFYTGEPLTLTFSAYMQLQNDI